MSYVECRLFVMALHHLILLLEVINLACKQENRAFQDLQEWVTPRLTPLVDNYCWAAQKRN